MKAKILSFCAIPILMLLVACGEKAAPPPAAATSEPEPAIARYSAEAFYETTTYGLPAESGHAFSPDGDKLLISSDQSGVFNVYALPVDGGNAEPLTASTDNAMFAVSWFPEDGRVLFTFDQGGNELDHVVVRETSGELRDLTPGENLKADFLGWAGDGAHFYLVTTERDQRNFDVYRYSTADYARELVFENPGFEVAAISGDGRWLALPEPVLVTPHQGNVAHGIYAIMPDNETLVFSTNEHGEFNQAWTHDLLSGEKAPLVEAAWDVSYVSYSTNGRYRVVGVNADARTEVTITDTLHDTPVALPELPPGDLRSVRFDFDQRQVALIVNADNSPSNVWRVDLEGGTARQLTDALNPAIDPAHLVASEIVRYPSFDGLEIPAVLYKPHGASAANPAPALVWVHGGPGGQTRTGYSATIQHLVNHGYAVLGANNRGSSGYGKTFFHLDDKRHGEEDLQDIVQGRKYLESLDWVDGERIGVIGGSYGGYMVAAALAFEPEAFDVGIDIFGVTNWVRTLESIPPWWDSFKEALYDEMGDPATDADRHRRISPLFHADNIVKPMLVVQGANDPRVLQVESDELVEAVRANEVPVEYIVFPDEGHGFTKKSNRIAASEAYVQFLDRYLR